LPLKAQPNILEGFSADFAALALWDFTLKPASEQKTGACAPGPICDLVQPLAGGART